MKRSPRSPARRTGSRRGPCAPSSLHLGGALAGAIVLEHQEDEGAVVGRLSAVSPACRGRGLGRALLRIEEGCGRALGARLVHGLAELDNLPQCALLEAEGRRLCGVVPDSERRRVAPGVTRYVPEAVYIKTLVAAEDLLWPEPAQLTPATTRLFQILDFPGAPPHLAGPAPHLAEPGSAGAHRGGGGTERGGGAPPATAGGGLLGRCRAAQPARRAAAVLPPARPPPRRCPRAPRGPAGVVPGPLQR